jgi:RimJ/RimL family protein N-acetyltransferase
MMACFRGINPPALPGDEPPAGSSVRLRAVLETDLPRFFEHQLNPEANRMAAFTRDDPTDRSVFLAHWHRILADDAFITRTVVVGGDVAGHVVCFPTSGEREITYWIDSRHWGKGVATQALARFLSELDVRPLYARVAADNHASLRVLMKCGFEVCGEDRGFSNARREYVTEHILRLMHCD